MPISKCFNGLQISFLLDEDALISECTSMASMRSASVLVRYRRLQVDWA